jgi:exodeoxyribonuclease V alpha subunit
VKVLQDADVGFLLLAPTGIAAKRMNSLTGAPAHTIHRAFGAKGWNKEGDREATYVGVTGDGGSLGSDGSTEQWEAQDHPAQVVIIDESSMMDQHLLYRVLTCTNPKARIVFVGDAAQLPSVGPGNVLRDLLETELLPTVALTQIFRQEDTSDIVIAAHDIHAGRVPELSGSGDFLLVPKKDDDDILAQIVGLAKRLYEGQARRKEKNLPPLSFQVLSPRHAGTLGVTNLNERLRSLLNPKSPGLQEMRLGREVVREDDRVMVVKNNYELGVFNGDVGKVSRLDRKNRRVVVKLHGPPVVEVSFEFRDAPRYLRLAYCQTIHKMQGQESDIILMPLITGFRHQLQRNLLYTAITRARKKVILVGHRQALAMGVMNNRPDARNTLFPERLLQAFDTSEVDQKAVAIP